MTSPLFGTAFLCSILFGVNGVCTKTLPENVRTTVEGQFVAGSVAGFSQTLVTCPMELVKIRMQLKNIHPTMKDAQKTTLIQQTTQILNEKRGYKTLFKGMSITLLRDAPGYGMCFALNQYILNSYKMSTIERNVYNDMVCSFVAGGTAGVLSWIPCYPLDVIKTRIQSTTNPSTDTRFVAFTRHLIKTEGLSVLTKGMGVQLVRAFPVDAVMFCVAAMISSALGSKTQFLL